MRTFWPATEGAQVDYEALREATLRATPLVSPQAARFARGGLAALIAHPGATAVLTALVVGVPRPPWTPYSDPRVEALAEGYRLLVAVAGGSPAEEATS